MADLLAEKGISRPDFLPNIINVETSVEVDLSDFQPFALMITDMVDEIKGISQVIEAWKKLNTRMNLLLIGDGVDRKRLEKIAESEHNIHFPGRKDHSVSMAYLHQAAFLIQNSRVETFGMVALEALACGKPVVYQPVGILQEMDTRGIGVQIKGDRNEDLVEAIRQLMEHPTDFKSEDLKQKVQPFGSSAVREKLLIAYEGLTG
jgi:glycosyltransferase involved in cell wall biosynthesis